MDNSTNQGKQNAGSSSRVAQLRRAGPGRLRGMRRMMTFLLVLLVGFYLAWLTVLYLAQDRMMFPTYLLGEDVQGPVPADAEVVTLPIEPGGQVEGWFLAAPGVNADQPGPAVLLAHGNAELIDHQGVMVHQYHALGVSVLLAEYRGYGRSDGRPSRQAIGQDMQRFYRWLIQQPQVDATRVVYHGRSLGGAVVAELAAVHPPRAMVLESSFLSVAALARRYGAPPFLIRHPYRTDRVLAKLDRPVLIFHGTRDEIIPVRHGRQLAALAPQATYVEYNATHNTFPGFGSTEAYWQQVERFLKAHDVVRPTGITP